MIMAYFKDLFRFAGIRAVVALGLLIFLGLTQGISILMLIPLMHFAGITDQGNISAGLPGFLTNFIDHTGISLDLQSVLLIYIGIVTVHAILTNVHTLINAAIEQGFTRLLRNRLYECIARADWLFITRTHSAELVHVLTMEINRIGGGTHYFLSFISTTVIVMVHIVIALMLSPLMTAITLGCAGTLALLMSPLTRAAHLMGKTLFATQKGMYDTVMEHLGGMKTAKSFGAEDRHIRRFHAFSNKSTRAILHFRYLRARTDVFYEIGAVVTISAIFYSALEIAEVPVAKLFLLVFLFARILPRVSALHQHYQNIINMLPAYAAVTDMQYQCTVAAEPSHTELTAPLSLDTGIIFQNVGFKYPGKDNHFALEGIDLHIPARQMTAVAGSSGAGKTTLSDLIMGLFEPQKGLIRINDLPLTNTNLHAWRKSVGYVPQDTFLFHDSVRANLQWVRPAAQEAELWEALEMAAALFVKNLPKGIDTIIGDRGIRLSGGERQRIALARALLRQPTLLLLDEATSSLDTHNEKQIQTAIEHLRGAMTMVVIAHRLSTIRQADQIIILNNGKIAETGTWNDLAAQPNGRFRAMLAANN